MSATTAAARSGENATERRLDFARLTEAAAARGAVTQEQIAELCGVYRGTLYRYRTGRLAPDWSTAAQIAHRLGLTFDELMPPVASAPPTQPGRPAGPKTNPPPAGPKTTPPKTNPPPGKPKNGG